MERAQRAVHERFRDYSCLYWWESAATAFLRRRGYCVQYNTALQLLLEKLDINSCLVHAYRVRLANDPSWRMGHVWLKVTIDGHTRDVCAGSASLDGVSSRFTPTTPVRGFGPAMRSLTNLGTAGAVLAARVGATIGRKPQPRWLHHPLDS
ncbi:MAG: hypothetical protein HY829_08980 [Actinobacteria bacterium]|nr:hypothetical protein [Actinomycetota bacterium]